MLKHIGILTSGGDCPGLNAAIRGVGKAARDVFDMEVLGFRDGFRGLVHDRSMPLESAMLSNILTTGGTILGTSRDKPHQMAIGGEIRDMTDAIVETYQPPSPRRADLHRRRGHAKKRPAPASRPDSTWSLCPRPSTTISRGPTSPSASTPPWASPPRPSTACIPPPPATIASSSWRSWAIGPAGSPSARASPAGPTSMLIPEIPYDLEPRRRGHPRPRPGGQTLQPGGRGRRGHVCRRRAADQRNARRKASGQNEGRPQESFRTPRHLPPAAPRTYHAAHTAVGKVDRSGVAADDSGHLQRGRHALGRRSPVGHAVGHASRRGCCTRTGTA